jgi:hypothetical protein
MCLFSDITYHCSQLIDGYCHLLLTSGTDAVYMQTNGSWSKSPSCLNYCCCEWADKLNENVLINSHSSHLFLVLYFSVWHSSISLTKLRLNKIDTVHPSDSHSLLFSCIAFWLVQVTLCIPEFQFKNRGGTYMQVILFSFAEHCKHVTSSFCALDSVYGP